MTWRTTTSSLKTKTSLSGLSRKSRMTTNSTKSSTWVQIWPSPRHLFSWTSKISSLCLRRRIRRTTKPLLKKSKPKRIPPKKRNRRLSFKLRKPLKFRPARIYRPLRIPLLSWSISWVTYKTVKNKRSLKKMLRPKSRKRFKNRRRSPLE